MNAWAIRRRTLQISFLFVDIFWRGIVPFYYRQLFTAHLHRRSNTLGHLCLLPGPVNAPDLVGSWYINFGLDIFWCGIIHLHLGQTILGKTNPASLADYDSKRPDDKYSPTRDFTLKPVNAPDLVGSQDKVDFRGITASFNPIWRVYPQYAVYCFILGLRIGF